jgi:hypothetical protein
MSHVIANPSVSALRSSALVSSKRDSLPRQTGKAVAKMGRLKRIDNITGGRAGSL